LLLACFIIAAVIGTHNQEKRMHGCSKNTHLRLKIKIHREIKQRTPFLVMGGEL
jgi:hypothetical protein